MPLKEDATPKTKRTAFLVAHGVGQHDKYETLAMFAAGLLQSLGDEPRLERRLVPTAEGVESVLSLQWRDQQIDLYEYYYQPCLQRAVDRGDVVAFIFNTIRSVRRVYKKYDFPSERREVVPDAEGAEQADNDLIAWHYMLKHRTSIYSGAVLLAAYGVYRIWCATPGFWQRALERFATRVLEPYMLEVFGDLVAYLAIDPKARLHTKRQEIIAGCAQRIKGLLSLAGEQAYDQVVVAGHSLGSVVTYDALSRVARDAASGRFEERLCDKLTGFVTFGSPLDKVAFVFWPTTDGADDGSGTAWDYRYQQVYAGMLPHFYGMRSRTVMDMLGSTVAQPQDAVFEEVKWVNYHCARDLVSGRLDAYDGVENREIGTADADIHVWKAFADHSIYWESSEMFDGLVTDFIRPAPMSIEAERGATLAHEGNHFFQPKSRPLILGHRGVPLLHQENTMAGFHRALELGLDGVEFDVFKTRDGKIVVFHDEDTERLTGVKGNITQMTWEQVSKLRIQRRIDMGEGRFVTYDQQERIPLLEEVLEEFKGKLLMNVEMKAYAPNWSRRHTGTEVARVIRRSGAMNSVVITSFDFFMLYYLERELPGLHSGFAYDDGMTDNAIGEWFRRFPEIRTDLSKAPGNQNDISFLNFVLEANAVGAAIGSSLVDAEYSLIDSDTVAKFHARNMLVGAYTVFPLDTRHVRYPDEDQVEVVRRLTERRVDWMETDEPEKVLELYASGAVRGGAVTAPAV